MPRRLRIQYAGALYHIINRGNYRRDLFETAGAAQAFESTLGETCLRHRWIIHGFEIMRNHFHLALETPEPNLVEGMHWLQSAYAIRFNRYRSERGHVFQGRYQSLLIEDDAALVRVIDYLHLNPVRAGIVTAAQDRRRHLSRCERSSMEDRDRAATAPGSQRPLSMDRAKPEDHQPGRVARRGLPAC